jgi:hypothetical protein
MADEKRARLKRLRADLDARGGRGIELAEEIDQLACELGDCVYDAETCGWKSAASHPPTTHTRFNEGDQEWQLVDNETHEILLVADTAGELEKSIEEEYGA